MNNPKQHSPSAPAISISNDIPSVTEAAARFALLRLISIQLAAVGFTHVQSKSLLEDVEGLVSGLLDGLVHLAYAMAQHARRSKPNIRDMIAACVDQGIEVHHLREILSTPLPNLSDSNFQLPLAQSTSAGDPTLDFLPSDPESEDEDGGGDVETNEQNTAAGMLVVHKRGRPTSERIGGLPHLPHLPAKHTWKHTALQPPPATVLPPEHLPQPTITSPMPSKPLNRDILQVDEDDPDGPACLGSLNRRILDTRLVERSLKNLVQPNPLPGKRPTTERSESGSPQKLQISDSDIPIFNYERDWYRTDGQDQKRTRVNSEN